MLSPAGLEGPKTPPLPVGVDSVSLPLHTTGQTSTTHARGEKVDDDDDDVDLNLSSVSDTSLASNDDDEEGETGPKTPPTEPGEPSLINVSDISSDMDNDNEQLVSGGLEEVPTNKAEKTGEKSNQLETTGVLVNQPEIDEEVPGSQPVVSKETTHEEESLHLASSEEVTKSADSAELSIPDAATASSESTAVVPVEDLPHPQLAEVVSQQESAPPSPTAVGTPTKTPGKRKVIFFL